MSFDRPPEIDEAVGPPKRELLPNVECANIWSAWISRAIISRVSSKGFCSSSDATLLGVYHS